MHRKITFVVAVFVATAIFQLVASVRWFMKGDIVGGLIALVAVIAASLAAFGFYASGKKPKK